MVNDRTGRGYMGTEREHLAEYNRLYKENDELYRNAAKALSLSDCAFWILYFLRESGEEPDCGLTQSGICSAIYAPKQTVNSSLKKLEEDGVIELAEGTDRRSKPVCLTEKGMALAGQTVDRVLEAEQRAFGKMTADEQTLFLELFRKYTNLLKTEIKGIRKQDQAEERITK